MIHSMTGYGRSEKSINNRRISAEIRSVNHRFFEFSCRYPRNYGFLEEKLKSLVKSRVSRGKIELYLSIENETESPVEIKLNHNLAKGYINAIREIGEENGIPAEITAYQIARFPDVISVSTPLDTDIEETERLLWEDVTVVVNEALDAFINMRCVEGEKLRDDVFEKMGNILLWVEEIEKSSPETVRLYRERLEEKIKELLSTASVDEQRLLTETAIFADRIAVDEETVRLRSHLDQMKTLLNGDGAVGRKLDFVLQEANREINTVGSKSQNSDIAKVVVNVKAELEKIREQIQNIE